MIEFLFALVVFPLAFAGLALGVLLGRHGIGSSCSGLKRIPGIERGCGGTCRRTDSIWRDSCRHGADPGADSGVDPGFDERCP